MFEPCVSSLGEVSDSAEDPPSEHRSAVDDAAQIRHRRLEGARAAFGSFSSGSSDTSWNHDEAFVESIAPLRPDSTTEGGS